MPTSGTPRSTGLPAPSKACCCATIIRPTSSGAREKTGNDRLGLIDFQDALIGPSAYDVASLAMDARVTVSAGDRTARRSRPMSRARQAAGAFDREAFDEAYAVMAAQRNSKILGIFVRLDRRDGKPAYLKHLPRIRDYLRRALAHPALADAARILRSPRPASRSAAVTRHRRHEPPWCLPPGSASGMRPITDTMPKPLVPVAGQDPARPRPRRARRRRRRDGCRQRPSFPRPDPPPCGRRGRAAHRRSPTKATSLLDSAGGIVKALPQLGGDPFYILNADTFWIDRGRLQSRTAGACLGRGADGYSADACRSRSRDRPLQGYRLPRRRGRPARARRTMRRKV